MRKGADGGHTDWAADEKEARFVCSALKSTVWVK